MTSTAKNILLVVVAIIIVGLGVWFYARNPKTPPVVQPNGSTQTDTQTNTADNTTNGNSSSTINTNINVNIDVNSVKEFTVVGSNFAFNPKEIRVKNGDRVKINFTSQNGNHDFVVDEFSAKTKVLSGGKSETIEFVVNKTGTFEYYCSVGSHRQMGMVGKLIVE